MGAGEFAESRSTPGGSACSVIPCFSSGPPLQTGSHTSQFSCLPPTPYAGILAHATGSSLFKRLADDGQTLHDRVMAARWD